MRVKAVIPDWITPEQSQAMAAAVEAACAEIGIRLELAEDDAYGVPGNRLWQPLSVDHRSKFEKARALVFDRFGVEYEWVDV